MRNLAIACAALALLTLSPVLAPVAAESASPKVTCIPLQSFRDEAQSRFGMTYFASGRIRGGVIAIVRNPKSHIFSMVLIPDCADMTACPLVGGTDFDEDAVEARASK
jgi:hypothetical protein